MEAGAQKWFPNGTKSGPKTGPPLGSPGAQKHQEFKGVCSFLASQRGPVLDSFLDPFWAQFRDSRISELFRFLIKLIKAQRAK